MSTRVTILVGDCRERLRDLADRSVSCVVTSPPYFRLRDYDHPAQIGREDSVGGFVAAMVDVMREVRRVLYETGSVWLNLGDTQRADKAVSGVPWRVALALADDGWILRQDLIWAKPSGLPEPVRDRCTRAHEHLFLLVQQRRYHFDVDAIREPHASPYSLDAIAKAGGRIGGPRPAGNNFSKQARQQGGLSTPRTRAERAALLNPLGRNRRSVWTVAPDSGSRTAHLAPMPTKLAELCIAAGCPPDGLVLDPFGGSGTTALAAARLGRDATLIEVNPTFAAAALAATRISSAGLATDVTLEDRSCVSDGAGSVPRPPDGARAEAAPTAPPPPPPPPVDRPPRP